LDDELPPMPLPLTVDTCVVVPLETTYRAAYRQEPPFWQEILEGRQPAPDVP
jgi:hypothetical protein